MAAGGSVTRQNRFESWVKFPHELKLFYYKRAFVINEGSPTTLKSRTLSMKSVKKYLEIQKSHLVEVVLEPYIYVFSVN